MGRFAILVWTLSACAQDPFATVPEHYQLLFENEWVQVAKVSYKPYEKAPVHDHPERPVVYVYTTDGGPLVFRHTEFGKIQRPAVKAGQIRYASPSIEKHAVEYLGDVPTEYLRIELKTRPIGLPDRDVKLKPALFNTEASSANTEYENGQLRIIRVYCAAGHQCPQSEHPEVPAVLISMTTKVPVWIEANQPGRLTGTGEYVRVELKSRPRGQPSN